ncbi:hypothetical protein HK105_207730 [Polyrhizophydium stewartii]|uniref:Transcription factor domain-containing protein n=1 Tax=Polyrhizophydium stewartii TaxID=2732419 RepID=A0ABR4MZT7_9FUNG
MVRLITACESCVRKVQAATRHGTLGNVSHPYELIAPLGPSAGTISCFHLATGTSDLLARIAHLEASIAQMASAAAQPQPTQPPLPSHHGSHGSHASPPSLAPLPSLPQFVSDARPSVWTPEERALIDRLGLLDPFIMDVYSHGILVSREFLLECVTESKLMELLVKSMSCALRARRSSNPYRTVASRLFGDASVELKRAIQSATVTNVLAIQLMSFCCLPNDHGGAFISFIELARRMALELHLNDEQALRAMPISEARRNDYRCVWFGTARMCWLFSIGWGAHMLPREDLHLLCYPQDLPLRPPVAKQLDDDPSDINRRIDFELASNTTQGWFIPPVPGRGVLANMLAVEHILSSASRGMDSPMFSKSFAVAPLNNNMLQHELDRRFMMLEASLDSWLQHAPDDIRFFEQRARAALSTAGPGIDESATDAEIDGADQTTASPPCSYFSNLSIRRAFTALSTYKLARILLRHRELVRIISTTPHSAANSRVFRESLGWALGYTSLLDIALQHRAFKFIGPIGRFHMSYIGIVLTAAKHLIGIADETKAQILEAISLVNQTIEVTGRLWDQAHAMIDIFMLEHLDAVGDPVEIFKQAHNIQASAPQGKPGESDGSPSEPHSYESSPMDGVRTDVGDTPSVSSLQF